jgi:hypothetical protein
MKGNNKWVLWIRWIARIWGGLVIAVVLMAVIPEALGISPNTFSDFKSIVLKAGLLIGLSIAYRNELIGGIIATLGIAASGFFHPLVFAPGLLYIITSIVDRPAGMPSKE